MQKIFDIKPYVAEFNDTGNSILNDILKNNISFVKEGLKKILLVSPLQIPSNFFDIGMAKRNRYFSYPPYGLGLIATELKSNGFEVEIIDLNFLALSNPEKFNAEKDFFEKVEIEKILKAFKPDAVGITCMFTLTHESFKKEIQIIKDLNPKLLIFAGGVHITNDPIRIKKEIPEIDYILPHESEAEFSNLLVAVNKRVFQEKTKSKIQEDKPLQIHSEKNVEKSIPDYCGLNISDFSRYGEVGAYRFWWRENTVAATVQGNRGCRAHCTFCSVEHFNGKGVRGRSVDSIIEELSQYKEKYGVNHIMWLDDDLFYNPKRAIELFSKMKDSKLDITWDASNGVIASAVSNELLAACAESGCIGMHVGIESGSSRILREIKKPSGVKHFLRLGEWLKNYPQIFTKGFLIMGFPNESFGDLLDTINLATEMSLDWYTVSVLTPLPSTKIYDQMAEIGLIDVEKVDTKEVNYGSMQTGTQKKLEESRKTSLNEILKINSFSKSELLPRDQLSELWFEVDYEINYKKIFTEKDLKRLNKLSVFLKDINKRMTNFSNPISLYFEHVVNNQLGSKHTEKLLEQAKFHVNDSNLWAQRVSHLNLKELV